MSSIIFKQNNFEKIFQLQELMSPKNAIWISLRQPSPFRVVTRSKKPVILQLPVLMLLKNAA